MEFSEAQAALESMTAGTFPMSTRPQMPLKAVSVQWDTLSDVHIQCVCVSMYLMDCSRKASHHSEDSLYAFSSPPLIPLTC